MKLSTSLVAVKKITSKKPRSNFADNELEQAANLILDSEGVINPILVRRTSLQSYEVIDGDFEYYAAARAREIEPRKGEMIGVFIIEPENEEVLTKQVEVFRQQKSDLSPQLILTSNDLEKFLTNLESRIEKITKQLLDEATAKVNLQNQVKELHKQIENKVDTLKVFKTFTIVEIASTLRKVGFPAKKASQIAEKVEIERNKQQFKSLKDVVERVKIPQGKKMIKAISSDKMLDIVDAFSEMLSHLK